MCRVFPTIVLAFLALVAPCRAWWEEGHQVIAILAFDLLPRPEQEKLLRVLPAHPRWKDDFAVPAQLHEPQDIEHWIVGRAGYWPDVARSHPEFHRSTWHYQLGPSLILGMPDGVPKPPGAAPLTASLQTQELHIAQAITVCEKVLRDARSTDSEKALAICWLAHLVADAHQPCHAGSLYEPRLFPEGDRGANLIPTRQRKNLHALWDSLLGEQAQIPALRRRCQVIRSDSEVWMAAERSARETRGLNPQLWLAESVEYARSHVYAPEILDSVSAVQRGLVPKLDPIELSEDYLQAAGLVARRRAAFASHRLARLWLRELR